MINQFINYHIYDSLEASYVDTVTKEVKHYTADSTNVVSGSELIRMINRILTQNESTVREFQIKPKGESIEIFFSWTNKRTNYRDEEVIIAKKVCDNDEK